MKKVWTSIALAAAALTLSVGAQAGVLRATIDFETPVDGTTTPFVPFAPLLGNGDEFYQPGIGSHTLFFDPFSNAGGAVAGDLVGSLINGSDLSPCSGVQCPTNNPTNFIGILDDAVLAFGANDGFRFSVKSFKASFIGNADPLATTPGFLRLQGVKTGATSLTQTFALSGPDASGNLNFGTFNTSGVFAATEWDFIYAYGFACPTPGVTGSCVSFATDRAQFALDDIVIEHVPEPASLALLGVAGLAAFGARRRRSV